MSSVAQYLRCPYCGIEGHHSKKVGKSVGLFRIKKLYTNVLVLKCMKCSKVCRVQMNGKLLEWEDMSSKEKESHKKDDWVNYKNDNNK